MTMKAVRWAVVGTGPISVAFARALEKVPGHQKAVVVSRDTERARSFATQHGFAHALGLDAASFDHPDIDAVYVGTPTSSHLDVCLRAIQAGKPVLCEKPMTVSATELDTLRKAAQARGVFVMEAMWLKFNPLIQKIESLLHQGALGTVISASIQIGYRDLGPGEMPASSADALADFGCYAAALALSFFGVPERVFAHGRVLGSAANGSADAAVAHANVMLDYGSFCVNVECAIDAELGNCLAIHGSSHSLSIPLSVLDPYRFELRQHGPQSRGQRLIAKIRPVLSALRDVFSRMSPLRGSGLRGEIAEVGASLAAQRVESLRHPLSMTQQAHDILQAARDSIRTERFVELRR